MKHAYLIIAHSEFSVLKELLAALDNNNNDIYVHIDKKVKDIPRLSAKESKLIILEDRIDVRWGNYSQILSEYALFEKAYLLNDYDYFHILSGTHIPLMSSEKIHEFYDAYKGKQIMQYMYDSEFQTDLKLRRYNFFTRNLQYGSQFKKLLFQKFWNYSIYIQKKIGIKRYCNKKFVQCSNWVSLTKEAVEYLIENKKRIIKKYRFSFCGDEFFVPTELSNSHLKDTIVYNDKMLKCDFIGSNPKTYTMQDYDEIVLSGCLFARKFNDKNIDVVKKIVSINCKNRVI